MASVINLNRFRKAKKRAAAEQRAAENRTAFGRTKKERKTAEAVMLERRFASGVPLQLDLLGHYTIIEGPWEDRMGHAQAIRINPNTHIFEGAADPRCDGLALGL